MDIHSRIIVCVHECVCDRGEVDDQQSSACFTDTGASKYHVILSCHFVDSLVYLL